MLAAVVTPAVVERVAAADLDPGPARDLNGVAQVFPFTLYTKPALWVSGFFLGLAAQGIKICVDTLVQLGVDDAFRGRVFSIYDMLVQPRVRRGSGDCRGRRTRRRQILHPVVGVTAVGYLVTASTYAGYYRRPSQRASRL